MSEPEQIAARINLELSTVKIGALRFWGHWFGKPYDNGHRIVSCAFEEQCLKLTFDGDEVLSIWDAHGLTISRETFRIQEAARVRWSYYGRPKTPRNRYFEDFTRLAQGIKPETNVDWYTPTFEFDLSLPAVEIL